LCYDIFFHLSNPRNLPKSKHLLVQSHTSHLNTKLLFSKAEPVDIA
jgi:hypothetical protein